jgi:histone-lysine N-methyltransferase SUV39H
MCVIDNQYSYEVRWVDWQRKDGSNTTWSRADNVLDEAVENFGQRWRDKMKDQARRRASESLSVRLAPFNFAPPHDKLTAEKAEAVAEKRAEYTRKFSNQGLVDWGKDVIRLGPATRAAAAADRDRDRVVASGRQRLAPGPLLQQSEPTHPASARRRGSPAACL